LFPRRKNANAGDQGQEGTAVEITQFSIEFVALYDFAVAQDIIPLLYAS
jgi:hypothetical protein